LRRRRVTMHTKEEDADRRCAQRRMLSSAHEGGCRPMARVEEEANQRIDRKRRMSSGMEMTAAMMGFNN
jgi:hypothetical protein